MRCCYGKLNLTLRRFCFEGKRENLMQWPVPGYSHLATVYMPTSLMYICLNASSQDPKVGPGN